MSALSYAERRALFLAAAIDQWDADCRRAHPHETQRLIERRAQREADASGQEEANNA